MFRTKKNLWKKICICLLLAALCMVGFMGCGGEEEEVDPDEPEVTTYTVTFDTNGGSEIDSQKVEEGGYATQPEDPTKTDYIFNGWYKDSELTTSFEFDTEAITEDTTIYAGWASEDDSTTCTATFYWNYDGAPDDGIYYTKTYVSGGKLTRPANPTRSGYSFEGWYMDTGFETAFVNNSVYEGDLSIYARWMYTYTFEAEDTQLTGLDPDTDYTCNGFGEKLGYGLSSNFTGAELIGSDSNASNGAAVRGLYYEGAYLDFEISSDVAETGASLSLRLSAEFWEITLTSSTFQVLVNGTALNYKFGDIVIDGSEYSDSMWSSNGTHEYTTIVINTIDLVEGDNLIRLYVNNNTSRADGTVQAMAPIVDCMYISSSSDLEMTIYENE